MRRGVVCGVLTAVLVAGVAWANPYDGRLLTLQDLKAEANDNEELDAYMLRNGLPDVAESRVLSDRPPWDDHQVTLYYLGTRKEISFARALVLGKPNVAVTRYERDLSDADVAALMGVLDTAAIEADKGQPVETVAVVETTETVVPSDEVAAPSDDTVTRVVTEEPIEVAALDDDATDDLLEDVDPSDPAARAEAAAARAEHAADRVEAAADKAEGAALRAEKAFDRLAAAFEARRKR